jgi:hypothetical protein
MIIQGLTNSFKSEMLKGVHDLETDVLKMALYTGSATLTPQTTVYSLTDEVVAAGYTAGGVILTGVTITTQTVPNTQPAVVYVDFADAVFSAALTARGALIYNSSKSDKSVAVISFGADKTSTTTFTVQMPANTASDALIRFP